MENNKAHAIGGTRDKLWKHWKSCERKLRVEGKRVDNCKRRVAGGEGWKGKN